MNVFSKADVPFDPIVIFKDRVLIAFSNNTGVKCNISISTECARNLVDKKPNWQFSNTAFCEIYDPSDEDDDAPYVPELCIGWFFDDDKNVFFSVEYGHLVGNIWFDNEVSMNSFCHDLIGHNFIY